MAKYGKIFPLTISFAAEPIPMLPMVTGGLSIVGSAGATSPIDQGDANIRCQTRRQAADPEIPNVAERSDRGSGGAQQWEDEVSWCHCCLVVSACAR